MTDLTPYYSQPLDMPRSFTSERGATVEAIIGAWLHAKSNKSHSEKTLHAYKTTIERFREMLQEQRLDLLSYEDDFIPTIADYAQVFASLRSTGSRRKGDVSPATFNQRLAILSSFYGYALKRRHITVGNPIDTVDRPSVEAYAQAQAIEHDLEERLKKIDPTTRQGARDLALLSLLLSTGRRVDEIAKLTREDLQFAGKQIRVTFAHTKGAKTMYDTLASPVARVLIDWLELFYEMPVQDIPGNAPLWVNVHHIKRVGEPLGYHGIAGICQHYLGTSKVHATRHTFAILMELAGAKLTDIQRKLGHKNAATTGIYMDKLKQDVNPFAEKIAAILGLEE